jgi:hypothetical protein
VVVAAFAALAAVGLVGVTDYGIYYDEDQQRLLGNLALDYVLHGRQDYLTNSGSNRLHGPAFAILLAGLERQLGPQADVRLVYQVRHLGTFVAFVAAVAAFFSIVRRRTGSAWWGLVGVALLVLSPRIWAEAAYNSKDIGFLACFVIAANLVDACVARPSALRASLAGLAVAFAIDVRIAGVLLVPLAWVLLTIVGRQRRAAWSALAAAAALFSLTAIAGAVLFWPLLWPDPWPTFVNAWRRMAHYPWNGLVLYLGQLTPARELPWHYLPVWIAISTPPATLALALLGGGVALARLCTRAGWRRVALTHDLLALGWFGLPVLVVLAQGSFVYDGWRQLYFVHPGMVLLGVIGLERLADARLGSATIAGRVLAAGALAVVVLDLAGALVFMVRWHPYAHVYLNALAGRDRAVLSQRFELDYWGLSNRQLLEAVVTQSELPVIRVYAANYAGRTNVQMLPPPQRARVLLVQRPEAADYFLTAFRGHPQDYPYANEAVTIRVAETKIAAAYRLR